MSDTLILIRYEAARLSRRRAYYVLRVAYAVLLVAVVAGCAVLYYALESPHRDAAEVMPIIGRATFSFYRDFQLLMGVLVGPAVVAAACVGEKATGTLALTRLGPRQVLWGTIGARMLLPASFLLAALPMAVLLVLLGGVSGTEVVNATANAVALALTLGAIAGAIALPTQRPVPATLAAMSWGAFVALGLPAWVDPVWYGALQGRWMGLRVDPLTGAPWPEPDGLLSPVLGALSSTPAGAVPALGLAAVLVTLAIVIRHPDRRARGSEVLLGAAATGAALWILPGRPAACTLIFTWIVSALATVAAARWWLVPAPRHAHEHTGRIRGICRVVARAFGWTGTAAWMLAVLLCWWLTPGNVWREPSLPLQQAVLMVGAVLAAVVATETVTVEREHRTWPLLCATPMSNASLARYLLLPSFSSALPFLLAGAFMGAGGAGVVWMACWAAFACSIFAWVALRTSTQTAWMLNLGAVLAYLLVLAIAPGMSGGENLLHVLAPVLAHHGATIMVPSTAVLALLGMLAFALLSRDVRISL